jgi:hypothetical protein
VAALPLGLPCERLVTYPGDILTYSKIPCSEETDVINDDDMAQQKGHRLRKMKVATWNVRGYYRKKGGVTNRTPEKEN